MRAKVSSAGIAVEHRGKYAERECRGHEQRGPCESREHHFAQLYRGGVALRELEIFFYALCLISGGHFAVYPLGRVERCSCLRHFTYGKHIGDRDQHRILLSSWSKFEVDPDQRIRSRPRNEVAWMRKVDVEPVQQIVYICLQLQALGNWPPEHRIKEPVSR